MEGKDNYKLSVIIPAYNCQEFIKSTVDSVLAQTFTDFEVIVVNDGSTDNTEELCKQIEVIDSRVKYFYKENGGAASARNFGLEQAKGEYIHFLDSDDFIHKKTYETIFNVMEGAELEICYFDYCKNKSKLDTKGKLTILPYHEYMKYFFGDKQNHKISRIESMSRCLAKKSKLIKERFLEGHTLEDVYYNFKILRHFDRVGIYNASLYFYNQQNENSVSTKKKPSTIDDILFVWETISKENKNKEFQKTIERCLLRAAVVTLYFIYKNKYEKEMSDTIYKCNKIIRNRKHNWCLKKNLTTKHKLFLFALILLGNKKIKYIFR